VGTTTTTELNMTLKQPTLPADLPTGEQLYENLRVGLQALIATLDHDSVHLIGIHSGGAWLAQRLHQDLGLPGACGLLDISLYRDDFDKIGLHTQVMPTHIDFPVAGKHLILVDDVLYTGRTIRAAMNELFDHGRPASIKLVVLIDRGGRQLPIDADFSAFTVYMPLPDNLVLQRDEVGVFTLHLERGDV
jgi:pyrimidine operon attenuation protein/uracil phosphoribosyltransferase